MSAYNQEFNKDNVVLRYIIVALLAELREKVFYYNQLDEDTTQKVQVPFYYSVTGNERLLLDVFKFGTAENDEAIGDYDVVPRGVIQLTGVSIDSGSLTNKFTRASFVRNIGGYLKTLMLDTAYIPLVMTFDTTVVCSSNLEMLKVTESLMSRMYKTTRFQVDLGMFRVEASVGLPEDYSQNKLFEYGLSDKKEFTVTFALEVKSFLPVFDGGFLMKEIDVLAEEAIDKAIAEHEAAVQAARGTGLVPGVGAGTVDNGTPNPSPSNIESTQANDDGTYTITFKDGTTTVTDDLRTVSPTATGDGAFPEIPLSIGQVGVLRNGTIEFIGGSMTEMQSSVEPIKKFSPQSTVSGDSNSAFVDPDSINEPNFSSNTVTTNQPAPEQKDSKVYRNASNEDNNSNT
tara:strand:- start:15215 stop:16417 length:1203 start_codon:yes stop_codon:yes gene_type:complete